MLSNADYLTIADRVCQSTRPSIRVCTFQCLWIEVASSESENHKHCRTAATVKPFGRNNAIVLSMLVRIVKQPIGRVDGVSVAYHLGQTYDVQSSLANYVVVNGYATIELRHKRTSADERQDRRKKPRRK